MTAVFDAARPSFAAIPRPAFGSARQHLPQHPPRHLARAEHRYQRAARTAAELLPGLPQPGEAVHALMTGTDDLCQVITATAARLTTLRVLRIATLCFSKRNAAELLALLEHRPELRLSLLVSAFFRGHNKELVERFAADLADHPTATRAAARSHCKVVAFDVADDDGSVIEGSANLRTNKNREQLCVIRDCGLHDWHAAWIDEMVSRGEEEAEEV